MLNALILLVSSIVLDGWYIYKADLMDRKFQTVKTETKQQNTTKQHKMKQPPLPPTKNTQELLRTRGKDRVLYQL